MTFRKTDNPKDTFLKMRLTEWDKIEIQGKASDCQLSMSEYLIRSALNRQTRSRMDVHQILEIRTLTRALRDMYFNGTPANDERLQPVLDAAVRALNRLAN
jgi:hypothetical protein